MELALGLIPNGCSKEALQAHKNDAHTKIKEAIQQGASADELQLLINQYGTRTNSFGLTKFAEQYRESLERQQDIADALDDLLLRGSHPRSTWQITFQPIGYRYSAFCGIFEIQ